MFSAVALAIALAAAAGAVVPVGPDLRLTMIGNDGDTQIGPTEALNSIAYNSKRNEYLLTYAADETGANNDFDVWGQRLSASGARIGAGFRISNDGAANISSTNSSVAYSAKRDEYLVAFMSDQLADNDFEIWGQRLSGTGAELGGDFRISSASAAGVSRDADLPAIAYDGKRGNYLVVFEADALALDNKTEIFAQRLSPTGAEIGGDVRVSTTLPEADALRTASFSGVEYGAKRDQFLIVWESDAVAPNKDEIFAQRFSGAGAEVGSDFRVSDTGQDLNDFGSQPDVAYGAAKDVFLVTFNTEGAISAGEREVFAQRVSGLGAPLGADFRISRIGVDGDAERMAQLPAVAYSQTGREFHVTWDADALATDNEREVFGQRVAEGGRLLDGNVRISEAGPDGTDERIAVFGEIASSTRASRYLAIWITDSLATNDEFEFFGQLLAPPRCGGSPATITGSAGNDKLKGTAKRDVIAGLAGRDTIKGLGGNDTLCGGNGKDKLLGGKQKDKLVGGKGRDKCAGGASTDRARSCERVGSL